MIYEIDRTSGGGGIVYRTLRVEMARFTSHAEAERYVSWRSGMEREAQTPPAPERETEDGDEAVDQPEPEPEPERRPEPDQGQSEAATMAEAIRRLDAGDLIETVADELGVDRRILNSRYDSHLRAKRLEGWQPGAAVTLQAKDRPLNPGWARCEKCRTPFNAAKSQAALKAKEPPTRCAGCRSAA